MAHSAIATLRRYGAADLLRVGGETDHAAHTVDSHSHHSFQPANVLNSGLDIFLGIGHHRGGDSEASGIAESLCVEEEVLKGTVCILLKINGKYETNGEEKRYARKKDNLNEERQPGFSNEVRRHLTHAPAHPLDIQGIPD